MFTFIGDCAMIHSRRKTIGNQKLTVVILFLLNKNEVIFVNEQTKYNIPLKKILL